MEYRQHIQDEELGRLLSGKNPAGMEILYDRCAGAMYGVIHRIVKDDTLAEEVLKESCLKIWNGYSQYHVVRGQLFTWILRTARDTAIDKLKSREYSAAEKNQGSQKPVAAYAAGAQGLGDAGSRLEAEHREILDLMYYQGLTQIEVALKLHLPQGTVKSRSRAAVQRLREILEKGNG